MPAGEGNTGEFVEPLIDPAQHTHIADRAVAMDKGVERDGPLDIFAHQLRRICGINFLRCHGRDELAFFAAFFQFSEANDPASASGIQVGHIQCHRVEPAHPKYSLFKVSCIQFWHRWRQSVGKTCQARRRYTRQQLGANQGLMVNSPAGCGIASQSGSGRLVGTGSYVDPGRDAGVCIAAGSRSLPVPSAASIPIPRGATGCEIRSNVGSSGSTGLPFGSCSESSATVAGWYFDWAIDSGGTNAECDDSSSYVRCPCSWERWWRRHDLPSRAAETRHPRAHGVLLRNS